MRIPTLILALFLNITLINNSFAGLQDSKNPEDEQEPKYNIKYLPEEVIVYEIMRYFSTKDSIKTFALVSKYFYECMQKSICARKEIIGIRSNENYESTLSFLESHDLYHTNPKSEEVEEHFCISIVFSQPQLEAMGDSMLTARAISNENVFLANKAGELCINEKFKHINKIDLYDCSYVKKLTLKTDLPNLEELSLGRPKIKDLIFLKGLKKLKRLTLDCQYVASYYILCLVKERREIQLAQLILSFMGKLEFQAMLCPFAPTVISDQEIMNTVEKQYTETITAEIEDLTFLKKCKNLKKLDLHLCCQITEEDIAKLQEALPNCKILY